jgi:CheY-like chemotaxis protein
VITARDGAEALALIGDPSFPRPCLILLDWWMAPMGGVEFLTRLRVRADAGDFSTIIVTGSIPIEDSVSVAGAVGFLPKPFELEDLARALDTHG